MAQARASLFELISQDPVLSELGLEETYPANGVDTPPEDFFAIISWGVTTASFGSTGSTQVSVWFHDRQRDYGRISDAIQRLKLLLAATVHRAGEDGIVLSDTRWEGESDDLFDPGYGTVARHADFVAISRYPSP